MALENPALNGVAKHPTAKAGLTQFLEGKRRRMEREAPAMLRLADALWDAFVVND